MADEFKHRDAGTKLTQAEDNAVDRHIADSQLANDMLYCNGAYWIRATPATIAGLLDHGSLAGLTDDDHTQYIRHALATAANDFLIASGSGVFAKNTLPETKTALGITHVENTAHSTDAHTMTIDGIDVSAHAVAKAANATLGHVIVEAGSNIDVDGDGKLTLGAHGVDQHTNVTRELFLSPNGYLQAGTAGATGRYNVILGGANAGEPIVYFAMKVPDDFVSFTSVKAVWTCEAASGNMNWQIIADYGASTEDYETHSEDPAKDVTATGGTSIINVQEPANALTLAGLAVGDYLGMAFARDGTQAADTLDSEVRLLGLLFTYVASQ